MLGSRDVVNGLVVVPPEEDSDGEMTDAGRIVLEKEPFVNASQIRVASRDRVVTLEGLVAAEADRDMVEYDAWCVFGVDRVLNEIAVRPWSIAARRGGFHEEHGQERFRPSARPTDRRPGTGRGPR